MRFRPEIAAVLLFLTLIPTFSEACSGPLEDASNSDERDWDASAAQHLPWSSDASVQTGPKRRLDPREAALKEIRRVGEQRAFHPQRRPNPKPEQLVRILAQKRLGVPFKHPIPKPLLDLGRSIVLIRLTGEITEREIARATKRNELLDILNRDIEAFLPSTETFRRTVIQEAILRVQSIRKAVERGADAPTSRNYQVMSQELSNFGEFWKEASESWNANSLLAILSNPDVGSELSAVLHSGLSPATAFAVRGFLALTLLKVRTSSALILPGSIVAPFVALRTSGALHQGKAELLALESGESLGPEIQILKFLNLA